MRPTDPFGVHSRRVNQCTVLSQLCQCIVSIIAEPHFQVVVVSAATVTRLFDSSATSVQDNF